MRVVWNEKLVESPRLGWWLRLVQSSAFVNAELPEVVKKHWGTDLIGASMCEIEWNGTPLPGSISMYGTVEDGPPDLEAMASAVRPFMADGEYFAFLMMMDPVLSNDGFRCIVFSNNSFLFERGYVVIETAVNTLLDADKALRRDGSL